MVGRPLLVLALLWSAAPGVLAQQPYPNTARDLAAACASCHTTERSSTRHVDLPSMPALAGRDPSEVTRLMQEFRSGKRPATVMHQIAKGYSDEQVQAIAAYLAAQKPSDFK